MSIEEVENLALKREKNYHIVNGDYVCKTCGSDILQVVIVFSIHDGPFALSGSGKTTRQVLPYCPKCEGKPEIHGMPISNQKQAL